MGFVSNNQAAFQWISRPNLRLQALGKSIRGYHIDQVPTVLYYAKCRKENSIDVAKLKMVVSK